MTVLGAFAIGVTVVFAIVGALLLRNEEKVEKAWRRSRAGKKPLRPGFERVGIVLFALFVVVNLGVAISTEEIFKIALAALYVLLFTVYLRRYKRSRRAIGSTSRQITPGR